MDQQIRTLSERGIVISLILLNYESADPDLRRILLHPAYNTQCPNHLSAFNTITPEGRAWYETSIQFLAERWSRPDGRHGRVWNWIVGNEVNSHWFWSNLGLTSSEAFATDYERTVRLTHQAVRRHSAHGRVFLSLEHHWNIAYPGGERAKSSQDDPSSNTSPRRPGTVETTTGIWRSIPTPKTSSIHGPGGMPAPNRIGRPLRESPFETLRLSGSF